MATTISELITNTELYQSGEIFSERSMAEATGTSVGSIRAAMSSMKIRGQVVRSEHYDGYYKPTVHWINQMRFANTDHIPKKEEQHEQI